MEGQMKQILLAALLLSALLVMPGDLAGAQIGGPGASYAAALAGSGEVPPNTSPASGQATFEVSADSQSLTYTVTVSNITNVISGHIHLAPAGQNGDIILPIVPVASPGGGPRSGMIAQGTATANQLTGPLQGKGLADLAAQMDAGNAYVNIHTASGASPATLQPGDIPAGEIRGQITTVSAPTAVPRTGGGFGTRTKPSGSPIGRGLALGALALLLGGIALMRRRSS
jgi:hypothetical protein